MKAEEAFYVDDIPRYVAAAAKLGIRGHVYTDGPTLRKALAANGVNL